MSHRSQKVTIFQQESLANAKVNARQHCVVWSHSNAGNAIWRTTIFHVVVSRGSPRARVPTWNLILRKL